MPPKPFWFPAKRFGWGWGPPRVWQGWTVLVAYLVLVVASSFFVQPRFGIAAFYATAGVLTAVLIGICWWKGEPPGHIAWLRRRR